LEAGILPEAVILAVLNNWSPPRVSQLMVDADLEIPLAYSLYVETVRAFPGSSIYFKSSDGGTSLRIRDTGITIPSPRGLLTDSIYPVSAGARVVFPTGIKTDSIDDNGAATIDILESIALAAGKSASVDSLLTDSITERTGSANISLNSKVLVDHIGEKTASHDIVFDDDIDAQEDFEAKLTQEYRSADAGATLRYENVAEETAASPGASPGVVIKTVTIPEEYADPSCTFTVSFTAKRTGTLGAGMYAAVFINGVLSGGTQLTLTESYQVETNDIGSLTAGDTIAIHGYGDGAYMVYVKDFTIKSSDSAYHPVGGSPTWS